MPHDKRGEELAVDDTVMVPCRVKAIHLTADYCNVDLETKLAMPPLDTVQTFTLNSRQTIKPTATHRFADYPEPVAPPLPAGPVAPPPEDPVCAHGTALDVHCCHCHSGFIFDLDHECPQRVADFWRCRTCGCVWRDNHDGSVSLSAAKQTSCPECEMKPTVEVCEPLVRGLHQAPSPPPAQAGEAPRGAARPPQPAQMLEVIVNGQPVSIEAGPVRRVIAEAIRRANQIGAPLEQWVLRTTDGEVIPHHALDGTDYELAPGKRLWLHLGVSARPPASPPALEALLARWRERAMQLEAVAAENALKHPDFAGNIRGAAYQFQQCAREIEQALAVPPEAPPR